MKKRERKIKDKQDGQTKDEGNRDEPPRDEVKQDERQRGNIQNSDQRTEKTFVQTAVQVGLITIPLAMYVSWAYKKFFPCPRVKCKPIPKPKQKRKLKLRPSSKSRLPSLCMAMESMLKRCTNGTKTKERFVDNCKCKHVQELPRDEDPCETLRYDVRDDRYDRGANERSNKPFASFYEDDFRDEVEASRQEQVYSGDRYKERQRLPERKSRFLKDKSSNDTESPHQQVLQPELDECASAEAQTKLQEGHDQQTELKQPAEKAPNTSVAELKQLAEKAPTTTSMNYCEYLKRPILDYEPQGTTQNETKLKKSERPSTEPNGQTSPSTALVVYNSQPQSGDNVCSESTAEEDLHSREQHQANPAFNITPEIMDSLCQQLIREYQSKLAEEEQNVSEDSLEQGERVNPKNHEIQTRDCCGKNSDIDNASEKSKIHNNENAEDEDIKKNQEDSNVCKDKYMQEILNRYKMQSTENKPDTSPGENEFETVDSIKLKSYNDPCDANFHLKNSDTPYVVKDYACKSTKSRRGNDDSGEKSDEDFEDRQQRFWHSCDPPKGLQKGCRVTVKEKGPCED